MTHPLFLLAIVTFILILAFAGWQLLSVKRRQKHGPHAEGIGGPNDPMS